jgi:ABC-type amino acid transport system permease subunit
MIWVDLGGGTGVGYRRAGSGWGCSAWRGNAAGLRSVLKTQIVVVIRTLRSVIPPLLSSLWHSVLP